MVVLRCWSSRKNSAPVPSTFHYTTDQTPWHGAQRTRRATKHLSSPRGRCNDIIFRASTLRAGKNLEPDGTPKRRNKHRQLHFVAASGTVRIRILLLPIHRVHGCTLSRGYLSPFCQAPYKRLTHIVQESSSKSPKRTRLNRRRCHEVGSTFRSAPNFGTAAKRGGVPEREMVGVNKTAEQHGRGATVQN
jgi:hypothetical protein